MNTEHKKRVIALGFFDGVHLGHGALLSRVQAVARETGATPSAVTFDTHPENLISKQEKPLISAPADRQWIMGHWYGIEDVIIAHFDKKMMEMPWEDFITEYLVKEHGAIHLVAGHDFHFGYKGQGNPQRLQEKCRALGLGCDIIPVVEENRITISSTLIRTLIEAGDIDSANHFLGHPHTLSDFVSHGKGLGKTLGFPTVNLRIPQGVLVPAYGVYATKVTLENGQNYSAVTNVGVRPTVDDDNTVTVEGFILDFSGDLYGQHIRMDFYHRIRGEQKFPSLEALRAEVLRNADQTRAYFSN